VEALSYQHTNLIFLFVNPVPESLQIDGPEITPKACAVITASVQSQYSSAQLQASASIRCKLAKPNLAEGFG
jgi:hypothetical protein